MCDVTLFLRWRHARRVMTSRGGAWPRDWIWRKGCFKDVALRLIPMRLFWLSSCCGWHCLWWHCLWSSLCLYFQGSEEVNLTDLHCLKESNLSNLTDLGVIRVVTRQWHVTIKHNYSCSNFLCSTILHPVAVLLCMNSADMMTSSYFIHA